MQTSGNKLIVALDVHSALEARRLVSMLSGIVGMFKIGSQLFTAAGPDLVREIIKAGERVFLDLKFHDIPNTVAAAGIEAARLGVSIFNVHAAGGSEMMRRTAQAVAEASTAEGLTRPKILAVTVLTSADEATLAEIGFTSETGQVVRRLSLLAEASGLDGVVASSQEVGIVRLAVKKAEFLVVTPGVRPADAARDDQKRVMSPREAIIAGADYLVVGRPIIEANDPARAAQQIVADMQTEAGSAKSLS
jgi:orotidine-5'-phosphate decarboxylase